MNGLLSLLLAGALGAPPTAAEQPTTQVTIGARVNFPSGKSAGNLQQRFTFGGTPQTLYVFTGKTLCETQTVSAERPTSAGNGWRIDLKPGATGMVQVHWERMWVGGEPSGVAGSRAIKPGVGSPVVLDSIDGGGRLARQNEIEKLKRLQSEDLGTIKSRLGEADAPTTRLIAKLNQLSELRRQLIEVQGLGRENPRVAENDALTTEARRELRAAYADHMASLLNQLEQSNGSLLVDGCDALSMSLQVAAASTSAASPTETEIWLVHKDPGGVETVQRQVVRSAGGNGSYVFDDIVVKTERGLVTIETYGSVGIGIGHGDAGQPWLNLDVNRRYVATNSSFGWKTKEGGTKFNGTIRPEEVLAFNLLPLKDDEGVLVGHRFSVRVRTKILK